MQSLKRFILALLLLSAMIICVGCNTNHNSETPTFKTESTGASTTPTSTAPEITETDPPDTEETTESTFPLPENEDMMIETPYCTLSIPYAFSELVSVEENNEDSVVSYTFRAELETEPVPVYTVYFVPSGIEKEGIAFGVLKTDDEEISILFEAYEPDKSLSEEDLESFYSAQETINDVFQSLREAPGFSPA